MFSHRAHWILGTAERALRPHLRPSNAQSRGLLLVRKPLIPPRQPQVSCSGRACTHTALPGSRPAATRFRCSASGSKIESVFAPRPAGEYDRIFVTRPTAWPPYPGRFQGKEVAGATDSVPCCDAISNQVVLAGFPFARLFWDESHPTRPHRRIHNVRSSCSHGRCASEPSPNDCETRAGSKTENPRPRPQIPALQGHGSWLPATRSGLSGFVRWRGVLHSRPGLRSVPINPSSVLASTEPAGH